MDDENGWLISERVATWALVTYTLAALLAFAIWFVSGCGWPGQDGFVTLAIGFATGAVGAVVVIVLLWAQRRRMTAWPQRLKHWWEMASVAKWVWTFLAALGIAVAGYASWRWAPAEERLSMCLAGASSAAGMFAALAAVLALHGSAKAQRLSNLITLLTSLEDDQMQQARSRLAPLREKSKQPLEPSSQEYECLILVLNRLEDAATRAIHDAVDERAMQASLHSWVSSYWVLANLLPDKARGTYKSLPELYAKWGSFKAAGISQ